MPQTSPCPEGIKVVKHGKNNPVIVAATAPKIEEEAEPVEAAAAAPAKKAAAKKAPAKTAATKTPAAKK